MQARAPGSAGVANPKFVDALRNAGLETVTSGIASSCLKQLSYEKIINKSWAGRRGHGKVKSVDYSGCIRYTAVCAICTFARFHGIVPAQLSVHKSASTGRGGHSKLRRIYSGLILCTPVCVIRMFGRFHGTGLVPAQTRAVPYRGLFLNNPVRAVQARYDTVRVL